MADPAVITGAFTLGGTLGGVMLGWFGQWWLADRRSLHVRGFAAEVRLDRDRKVVLQGDRFNEDHIAIRIVNKARSLRISEAGFKEKRGSRSFLLGISDRELPRSLARGDDLTLTFKPSSDLADALAKDVALIAYCEDTEGRCHRGKVDPNIERLRAKIRSDIE